MSNRIAWIAVAVVVIVVGILVFRSMRPAAPVAVATRADGSATTTDPAAPDLETPPQPKPAARTGPKLSGVQRVQTVMKAKGYWDGPIDGNYTPAMAEAIQRYQKDNGMKVDGYLNWRLYEALGLRAPAPRRR
jgi:peptidoglycan hydrolase-like protein with peptidoglycan-binding domain